MQSAVLVLSSFGGTPPGGYFSPKVFERNNLSPKLGLDRSNEKTRRYAGSLAFSLI